VAFVAQLFVAVWRAHNKPQTEQTASDCKNGKQDQAVGCI